MLMRAEARLRQSIWAPAVDPALVDDIRRLLRRHGLSDAQLEQALKVRIDFMVFTGFEPGDPFPDATTICRFRNRLVAAKLDQVLLKRINGQLERQGLKVSGARGAIIDATIIPSAARPRQRRRRLNAASDRESVRRAA